MDYTQQQQFLRDSRFWGGLLGLLLVVIAEACLRNNGTADWRIIVPFGLTVLALAGSLYYTPDYLHLTVNWTRRPAWQIKIRWRLAGAALILGLTCASAWHGRIVVLIAVAWLLGTNFLARLVGPRRYFADYFWTADFLLMASLLLPGHINLLPASALLAAAAHLSIVICEENLFRCVAVTLLPSWLLLFFFNLHREQRSTLDLFLAASLVTVSSLGTAFLVYRARKQNSKNVDAAMRELVEFTGYAPEKIHRLWEMSNQYLAANWQRAAIPEDDRERLAEWYRDNSELYLFAISAYNLDYRRIRSNLYVLQFARGACLDYGAGNGELVLEMARRGHPATHFDVEGTTMKFARQRAQRMNLAVHFFHNKQELEERARRQGLDTVFAFDVLEHLPDLAGELNFLSSLLNPGGLMVFDVPAGSTRSHPMHLNHRLDVREHLLTRGLEEKPSFAQRLPFTKQEKYVFRATERSVAAAKSGTQR